jgi:uncharacterized YigZ family protein
VFVGRITAEIPDAIHHCWAFVAGPPGTTVQIGMSDAGEPRGTAGRPILNALLHSEVGEVVAVVSRYFGGVKLGKGGLSRAYADSVAAALATLPTEERIERVHVRVEVPYRAADRVVRLLAEWNAPTGQRPLGDGEGLELRADVPADQVERLRAEVASITSGAGRVEAGSRGGEAV